MRGGPYALDLASGSARWHPDGDDGPGALIPACAEEGGAPSIPGPFIRVPAGTEVALTVRSSLAIP
jgi:hypothetical protein